MSGFSIGLIFLFAGLGALLRVFFAHQFDSESFPYGIFIANVFGSFLIGIFYSVSADNGLITPQVKFALIAGFLGALTTFSSYSLDILNLIEKSRFQVAAAYFFSMNFLGLFGCWLGLRLGHLLPI